MPQQLVPIVSSVTDMANAAGRLVATLLSGILYQAGGVGVTLSCPVALAAAGVIALFLPPVAAQASCQKIEADE
jgi:hypothetical protein